MSANITRKILILINQFSKRTNMVRIQFDHYHRYEELTSLLKMVATEFPKLCNLNSIGKSTAGRELWIMEITNYETGPPNEKPSVYIDGNTHAGEVTGREVCLWMIQHVLENYEKDNFIKEIIDTRCLYILPCLNPDGAELYLTTPYRRTGGGIPNPEFEWKDGLYEEDVNGDGQITQMRIEDPNGDWKVSEKDARIMVKRKPNEFGGKYYKIFMEGQVRGFDGGEIKMAPPRWIGGTNRNWPERWKPESRAYGVDIPLDEPEARAQADFWRTHKNICGGLAFHTYSGIIVRSYSAASDDELDIRDIATYEFIGEIGTELTGDLKYPSVGGNSLLFTLNPKVPRVGTAKDFFFDIMGVYAWTYELWDIAGNAGLPNFKERGGIRFLLDDNRSEEENLLLLKWNDEILNGEGFIDWTPFDHPQLGPIEIGGWEFKYTWQNPPPKFLEDECRRAGTFMLNYASLTPLIKLFDVNTKHIAPNLYKISAVIKNTGFLPTNITERAKNANIAKAVVVEIILDAKSQLVIGKKKAEIGHLEGRSKKLPGRFYTLLGPKKEPTGRFYGGTWGGEVDTTSKYVEWLIRTSSEKPNAVIKVMSEKGGTDSKKIKFIPHKN
jgi:murein tripeptide amidase MpaA